MSISLKDILNPVDKPKDKKPDKKPDSFKCPKCGKSFGTKEGLKDHMNAMHAKKPVTYVCPTCKRTFDTKESLNQHINDAHKKAKPKKEETGGAVDNDYVIHVRPVLYPGRGRIQRGKRTFLSFMLKVEIANPKYLKIKSIVANVKCGSSVLTVKMNEFFDKEIKIESNSLDVTVTVTVVYKVGFFESKTVKATVSQRFNP